MKRCSVEDCKNLAAKVAGLCHAHYKRKQLYGDVHRGGPIRTFGRTQKFLAAAYEYSGDECLIWPFARNNKGYGHIGVEGHVVTVHRYVCEKTRGPAPLDKPFALHTCASGHLGCIAPRHLKWGSHSDNMIDMVRDGHSTRGERAAHAKLTADDVRAIRIAKGTQQEIADKFGVEQTNISAILRRKSWAHVP